jgi:hypothetical protein
VGDTSHGSSANLYDALVGVPQLLADASTARKPSLVGTGSPVRYYAPLAPLLFGSSVVAMVDGWRSGADKRLLIAAAGKPCDSDRAERLPDQHRKCPTACFACSAHGDRTPSAYRNLAPHECRAVPDCHRGITGCVVPARRGEVALPPSEASTCFGGGARRRVRI